MKEIAEFLETVRYYFSDFVLFRIQDAQVTLSHIAVAVVAFLVSIILSKVIRTLLSRRLFKKMSLDSGVEYALLKFVHYTILVVGIYVGLKTINIPLGAAVGLFAVLGVGIGFGLQSVAANFISGIILLVERPVKIGDRVEVDGICGDIQHINLRTTEVNTPDNITIIVPNSKLLENNVINYSYGDRTIRLRIPVGIAYGSDIAKAEQVMLAIAADNKGVMSSPPAKVWMTEFGDSSLNMELLCWIPDAPHKNDVMSEVNFEIERRFREEDIEIPFPQRDIHLRSPAVLSVNKGEQ